MFLSIYPTIRCFPHGFCHILQYMGWFVCKYAIIKWWRLYFLPGKPSLNDDGSTFCRGSHHQMMTPSVLAGDAVIKW